MPNPSTYFKGKFANLMPTAAIGNTNAPVFSGISGLVANTDASLTYSWGSVTGSAQTPVRFQMFIAAGSVSAAALFVTGNRLRDAYGSSSTVYMLADGSFLTKGVTYTAGVRAVSANGISETNTAILTAAVTGVSVNTLPSLVWDELKLAHTIAGSFGDYLDTKVSLAQTTATALTQYNVLVAAIGTLQTAATALTQYGNLQTAIGLLQTASTALTQYGNLITAIGTPQQASTALSQYNAITSAIGLTQTAATALSQFNTLVSDIGSITPPDNASIAAIKAQTDQLSFHAGAVNANSVLVADKTGYSTTSGDKAAITVSVTADIERAGGLLDSKSSQTSVDGIQTTSDEIKKLSGTILGNVV